MATYYLGQSILEELESTYSWNLRQGYTRVRHFRGEIEALKTFAENTKTKKESGDANEKWFIDYVVNQPSEQDYAVLDLTYMVDIQELWTFVGSDQLESIWLKPSVVTFSNTLDDSQLAYMHEAIEGGVEKKQSFAQCLVAYPEFNVDVYGNAPGVDKTMLNNLYDALLRGNDVFFLSNLVLRRENIIPNETDILSLNMNMSNVGKYYTYAALVAAYPSMPSSYQSTIRNTGYYIYKTPTIIQTSNNKLSTLQEWEWSEAINSFLYSVAT